MWESPHCCDISHCERYRFLHTSRSCEWRSYSLQYKVNARYVEQEIIGDSTTALDSVLQADVWRHKLMSEEAELNIKLEALEKRPQAEGDGGAEANAELEREKDELSSRMGDIQKKLVDMEAETGPARAGLLLAGLGFSEADQQRATSSFSGGWRMRLALARALFVKPDVSVDEYFRTCRGVADLQLLMLDEPSNMLDLNAIAWLEDYLQTWPGTILVV